MTRSDRLQRTNQRRLAELTDAIKEAGSLVESAYLLIDRLKRRMPDAPHAQAASMACLLAVGAIARARLSQSKIRLPGRCS